MNDYEFVERESHEAGFSEVFNRAIVPNLRALEDRRNRAIARSRKIIAAIALASLFLAWQAYRLDPILSVMPVAFGAFAGLFVYLSRGDRLKDDLARALRPVLCDFLGDVSLAEDCSPEEFGLEKLERLGIVPRADRRSLGPRVSGSWRGLAYQLVKAHFQEVYRTHDDDEKRRTLFSGILLEIECRNPMPTIVFFPDFGEQGNQLYSWATRKTRPPHRLELPNDLERSFEVYTDDPERAKAALDTSFGHRLLGISREFQGEGRHMAAAFEGRAFYMAMRLDHAFLDFDVMKRPLSEVDEMIHQALADLTIPRRVIDRLLQPA